MNFAPRFIDAMKRTRRKRFAAGHVVTVVGEVFTWGEAGIFADNFIALHYLMRAIAMFEDPFASQQGNRVLGTIVNGHKVNKSMRFFHR